jgi:hypothetical protein
MASNATVHRLPLANEGIQMIDDTRTSTDGFISVGLDRLSASTVLWGDHPPREGSVSGSFSGGSSCVAGL